MNFGGRNEESRLLRDKDANLPKYQVNSSRRSIINQPDNV